MKVRTELLVPGVQHQRESDLTTQFALAECQQSSGRRIKQQLQQRTLVLFAGQDPLIEFVWQREDLMEIGNRQQFELSSFAPSFLGLRLALRAVTIAATVVPILLVTTRLAPFSVPTQCGGAAIHDRAHHLEVTLRDAMSLQKFIAVESKNVSQLDSTGRRFRAW